MLTSAAIGQRDPALFTVPVYRLQTQWPLVGSACGVENNFPLRIDILTTLFFALSATSHAYVVVIGFVSCGERVLWSPLERGFAPHRWVEYSLSASVMIVALAILTGLREEKTLALLFALMWQTNAFGLITELCTLPFLEDFCYENRQKRWIFPTVKKAVYPVYLSLGKWSNARWERLFPHLLAWPGYVLMWGVILVNYNQQLDFLMATNLELFHAVHSYVDVALYGTIIFFTSFAVPQLWFMLQAGPHHFWCVELTYCALSLTSKSFLGAILLINVLYASSFADSLASFDNKAVPDAFSTNLALQSLMNNLPKM